jgi:hypothetical protein
LQKFDKTLHRGAKYNATYFPLSRNISPTFNAGVHNVRQFSPSIEKLTSQWLTKSAFFVNEAVIPKV